MQDGPNIVMNQPTDFSGVASNLGISQEELLSALEGPPPDLERTSELLGVSIDDLYKILPPPPIR